jgi:hypothetical protein
MTMNEPLDMTRGVSALAESLAVAEGNLALFWGSSSHRNAYLATAAALMRPLEVRGWALARIQPQPTLPTVSP